jgi:hypothetical protein
VVRSAWCVKYGMEMSASQTAYIEVYCLFGSVFYKDASPMGFAETRPGNGFRATLALLTCRGLFRRGWRACFVRFL